MRAAAVVLGLLWLATPGSADDDPVTVAVEGGRPDRAGPVVPLKDQLVAVCRAKLGKNERINMADVITEKPNQATNGHE